MNAKVQSPNSNKSFSVQQFVQIEIIFKDGLDLEHCNF